MDQDIMTAFDASVMYNVSRQYVYRLMNQGLLPYFTDDEGKRKIFAADAIMHRHLVKGGKKQGGREPVFTEAPPVIDIPIDLAAFARQIERQKIPTIFQENG